MKISFGIISDGTKDERITQIINSIYANNIPKDSFEIIIVGNSKIIADNTIVLPFDESQKPGWITKKKNEITKIAQFDNIVYTHDYVSFSPSWYEGFLRFGQDWDICMTPIITKDGGRYRDWAIMGTGHIGGSWYYRDYTKPDNQELDINGLYWVAKRSFMERFPLNEALVWGDGEDKFWSDQHRGRRKYVINTNSWVFLLKNRFAHCCWRKDVL